MSHEDFDIVTEVKMAKERQITKICMCPVEGCNQVCNILYINNVHSGAGVAC
jgi:hypothetical protein